MEFFLINIIMKLHKVYNGKSKEQIITYKYFNDHYYDTSTYLIL